MTRHFVDTNVFIHCLFDVDPKKQLRCVKLFQQANQGSIRLWTSQWVIAELVWFLTKQKFSWSRTKQVITHLLATKGLQVQSKKHLLKTLDICTDNLNFIDALNIVICHHHQITTGYSYDRGLDHYSNFSRQEP